MLGACTPGTFSEDVRKMVAKIKRHGHQFGKTSVCVTCGDGAGMNENLSHSINITFSLFLLRQLILRTASSPVLYLIILALKNCTKFKLLNHCQTAHTCRIAQRKLCNKTHDDTLCQLLLSVSLTKGMPDAGRILERGWDTNGKMR